MKQFTLPSFAKINLFLKIAGKRMDGFHELCTVFQTVSLCDELTFSEDSEVIVTAEPAGVPQGPDNIVFRAAAVLNEFAGTSNGARIRITKKIPSPGGLGGGSSNAAIALVGLCRMWKLDIDREHLHPIAERLGSDVPFFLRGGTALGLGRGTEIVPTDDFQASALIIVTPEISVSTAEAYSRVNARNLTSKESKSILKICRFEAETAVFGNTDFRNDFETSVFERYPEIAEARKTLLDLGARRALMSGSGASVFGIFENEETRQAAMKALDARVNWRKFAVAAISRDQYREALQLV